MRGSMIGVRWKMAALALVALTACGDGEGGGTLAALGVKDGASRGVSKSVEASPDQDVSIQLSTGAQLAVPKGAVDKALTVTMERPSDTKAVDLVQRFKSDQDRIVSAPYVLKPHGTKFNEEVTVTLPLSKMGTRDEVEVAWLEDEDDTEWKKLGVAKSDGRSASITLKHFSVLVVVEDASDLRPVGDNARPDAGAVGADAGAASDAGTVTADAGASSDAGSDKDAGEPSLDASTSLPGDAGAKDADNPPDAGTDVDAGAGLDAGAQLDASPSFDGFVPVEPDADTQLPDSGTAVADSGASGADDASVPHDAGDFAQTFYAKLESCGYITKPGGYSFAYGPGSIQECEFNCYASGTCEDVMGAYCSFPIGDAGGFSPAVAACFAACRAFTCPGGGSATRCNGGEPECASGEDERFCNGTFTCGSGEVISYTQRCDGNVQCPDSSDEQGCFVCDAGTVLPPEAVCDYLPSCNDGKDEPASCAEVAVSCASPTQ